MAKKGHRTAAQMAATRKMIAANKSRRGGHHSKKSHHPRAHNPGSTALMLSGGAPMMTNPKRRKRRRNPGGVMHALGQLGLATGGAVVGVGLVKLLDTYIPVGPGALAAIEAGTGLALTAGVYMLSPAAATGLFGSMEGLAGLKLLNVLLPVSTTPAPTKPAPGSATSGLGAVEYRNFRKPDGSVVSLPRGSAPARSMGAVEIVSDKMRAQPSRTGAVGVSRTNLHVSGSAVDRAMKYGA